MHRSVYLPRKWRATHKVRIFSQISDLKRKSQLSSDIFSTVNPILARRAKSP